MQTLSYAEALERLVPRREKFMGIALRRNVPPCDAEDVVQDTYLRIAEKAHTLQSGERLEAWADTIAGNLSWDYHRQAAKERNLFVSLEERQDMWYDKEEKGEAVTEVFAAEELQRISSEMLHRAMSRLSEKEQLIFRLHFQKGYKYKAIAEMLGMSHENVRITVFRAKDKLERYLNEYMAEEEAL